MYPKVKVREEKEEADQYAYEKSSLQSLKAFQWLSLADRSSSSSSDESPRSVVRIPWSSISKSPPPSYYAPKEETNKKKSGVVEEPKNIRAASSPRPRAVLSSPVNDRKIGSRTHARKDDTKTGSKTPARKELFMGLKNHNSCQNRHAQCKVLPKSTPAGTFEPSPSQNKAPLELKNYLQAKALPKSTPAGTFEPSSSQNKAPLELKNNNLRAKVKTAVSGSSSRAAHQKRVAVVPVRTPS